MPLLRSTAGPALRIATLVSLLAGVSLGAAPARRQHTGSAPRPSAAQEVARIRLHFDSVLTELTPQEPAGLTTSQRDARHALLAELRRYRDGGVFPHNYDFPEAPTTYFVDRKTGTRCAVAHLLDVTGRDDIVSRVAREDNNVLVPALATDTAFAAWLHAHGITLAEAARIQVPYVSTEDMARQTAFSIAAPLSIVTSAAASGWNAWGNADGRRRSGAIVGFTAGVLATALSTSVFTQDDANSALRSVGGAGAAIGVLSIGLATRSWRRHDHTIATIREREAETLRARSAPTASITPLIPIQGQSGAGFAMSIRF